MTQTFWDKPVIIITGGFGSGKSEYAINLALQQAENGPLPLVGLDLVNAFFRCRETSQVPETHGVKKLKA